MLYICVYSGIGNEINQRSVTTAKQFSEFYRGLEVLKEMPEFEKKIYEFEEAER